MGCPRCGCPEAAIRDRYPSGGRTIALVRCLNCGEENHVELSTPQPQVSIPRPEVTIPVYAPHRTRCQHCGSGRTSTSSSPKDKAVRYHKCFACGKNFKTPKDAASA